MLKLKDIRMKKKLVVLFLVAGLVPLAVVGLWSSRLSSKSLMKQAFNQLTSVRELKHGEISNYFRETEHGMDVLVETVGALRKEAFRKLEAVQQMKKNQLALFFDGCRSDAKTLADTPFIEEAIKTLDTLSKEAKDKGLSGKRLLEHGPYKKAYDKYQPYLKKFMQENGYYDVFLFSPNSGRVLFTVAQEDDFGTELKAETHHLAKAWQQLKTDRQLHVTDMAAYAPSHGAPAIFVLTPAFNNGNYVGAVGVQISQEKINQIMLQRAGMGQTGESYLVGSDGLMRSDSFLDPQGHSVVASFESGVKVDTEATRSALAGNDAEDVILDYNGNPVLSVWSAIELGDGVRWAMMSEVDVAEAFSPVDETGKDYYVKYAEKYGFYDLFLIEGSGYCFYSVAKEADYQTNLANGKFASSNLGELVRRVQKSHKYEVADFAPYAPSKGEPAAFVAQPIVDHRDNELEMIVALQLPLEKINQIMQQREGLGRTGETYLVGPDKLMRSDSFLDPEGHSVKASFAGTVPQNGVDTEASREALAGKTETEIINDYNGNPVLASYMPLEFNGLKWALIAEIDQAEVLEPVKSLYYSILLVALVMAAAVSILGFFIARQIAEPLAKGVEFAKRISDRDLTSNLDIDQGDEIGDLAKALNGMVANLGEMIREIDNGVGTLSSSSTEMSTIATQMSANADTTVGKANTVSAAAEEMSSNMNSVAAAMEQASINISSVASGTEEMSASIGEIAQNAAQARQSVDTAVERSRKASSQVNELGKAAEEIEVVTETIKAISDKTNLLALNATIEAARAGEAGKGFAVVANEIKELAKQTAAATEDIASKLQGIQNSTGMTVEEIEEVSAAINQVNEVVGAIAAAVEQQNASTKEITENLGQASMGLREINENVSQATTASGEIAREISEVNEASSEMSNSSAQVQQSSGELSRLAEQLKQLIGRFRV